MNKCYLDEGQDEDTNDTGMLMLHFRSPDQADSITKPDLQDLGAQKEKLAFSLVEDLPVGRRLAPGFPELLPAPGER